MSESERPPVMELSQHEVKGWKEGRGPEDEVQGEDESHFAEANKQIAIERLASAYKERKVRAIDVQAASQMKEMLKGIVEGNDPDIEAIHALMDQVEAQEMVAFSEAVPDEEMTFIRQEIRSPLPHAELKPLPPREMTDAEREWAALSAAPSESEQRAMQRWSTDELPLRRETPEEQKLGQDIQRAQEDLDGIMQTYRKTPEKDRPAVLKRLQDAQARLANLRKAS